MMTFRPRWEDFSLSEVKFPLNYFINIKMIKILVGVFLNLFISKTKYLNDSKKI